MAGKLYDPRTHDAGTIWEPRARIIQRCALGAKLLIDYLKGELIKQSDSLRKQDPAIVKKVLDAYGNGDKLFEKMVLLKDSVTSVLDMKEFIKSYSTGEEINRESIFFYKNILQIDVAGSSKADWLSKNFYNCSPLLAVLVLNKIKASVVNTENICVNHCSMKVTYNFCGYFKPSALASLDNIVVRSGEKVLVTAGVGMFGKEAFPKITINGTRIKLYENPVARYEFIATGKPGTYNVPVKIVYRESDGSWQTASKELQYIITDNK